MFTMHDIFFFPPYMFILYIVQPLFSFSEKQNKKTIKASIFFFFLFSFFMSFDRKTIFSICNGIRGKNIVWENITLWKFKFENALFTYYTATRGNIRSLNMYRVNICVSIFFIPPTLYTIRYTSTCLICRHLHSLCKINTAKRYPPVEITYCVRVCIFFFFFFFPIFTLSG